MGKQSSSKSSVLLLMVVVAMISGFPREAEAGKLTISWPKWFWCFPDCVIGETCFLKVHRYCTENIKEVSIFNCIVVALEWCDLMFFDINLYIPPTPAPPALDSPNGDGETENNQIADLE